MTLKEEGFCSYPDASLQKTYIYCGEYQYDRIVQYVVHADLTCTVDKLPLTYGRPLLCADLDVDGVMELIVQRGSGSNGIIDIYSIPKDPQSSWTLRGHVILPGMKVVCHPVAVNVDSDAALELWMNPCNMMCTFSQVLIIQFNPLSNLFEVTDSLWTAEGTHGPSAVGDVDNDGYVEFIVGSWSGYRIFEYTEAGLVDCGTLGKPMAGTCAIVVRPQPSNHPLVLLGYQTFNATYGFSYYLLKATGNNVFTKEYEFSVWNGGWTGDPLSCALDADQDGLEEIALNFYPKMIVFDWDQEEGSFVQTHSWDMQWGTFMSLVETDVNWNGMSEWCVQDHKKVLRVFEYQGA